MPVVQLGGLEPPTSCSTDRRSNQLSYNCIPCRPQKRAPKKGSPNGAETRCNASLWQGREMTSCGRLEAIQACGESLTESPPASRITRRQKQKARVGRPGFFGTRMPYFLK